MTEKVWERHAFPVLTAARALREEICGKVADKVALSGKLIVVADPYAQKPEGAND